MKQKTIRERKPASNMKGSHISVCICTYRRPDLLWRLLEKLGNQETGELFTYSIIVVDNDDKKSAKNPVKELRNKSSIPIDYYNEPRNSIPLARNMAVKNAEGRYVAFIDDDEFPLNDWLLNLYQTYNYYDADGVLGPVKPHFETAPPRWIIKGNFFERPSYKTGYILHWKETRTGNVLLQKNIFNNSENMFNPEFRHGEDKEFFKRMTEKGYGFVWCNEAPVYETQTSDRFKRTYLLKRALLRASFSSRHASSKLANIYKSLLALTIYTMALPALFLIGHHIFMKYLIKDFDHIGVLLAAFGVNVEKYTLLY